MSHLEIVLLFLLTAVTVLAVVAQRLDVPYPILLVVGGCALGFVPGLPDPELEPELVLLIFLPPLLYDAALRSSRRELRRNLRPIALGAIGLVLATIVLVAVAVRLAIPGLPWAAAFAFGAIVSPTDPLAAVQIAGRLGVPHRLVSVIEGESLVNDGTALTAYATAVAAVAGSFSLAAAGLDVVVNVGGGAVVGLVVAQLISWALRRIDDDKLAVTVTVLAGYAAYLPAEELGLSGIIAAVVVGLVVGHRIATIAGARARLSAVGFWDVGVFLLNAVLFVLVGLQLPTVLAEQDRSAGALIALGVLAAVVVIGARMLWLHTVPFAIRALDRNARRSSWRERTVLGWSGLRGAVSLAAALALPAGFPERELLVWLTLCVILATLVLQGLTLPWMIRRLGVEPDDTDAREAQLAREAAARAALARLDELRDAPWVDAADADVLRRSFEGDGATSPAAQRLLRDVLDAQRRQLIALRDERTISDLTLYAVIHELDHREAALEG